ncbi:phage antirepressor KilAC domain-containing protein [Rhodococcus sp. NPDC058532]|uniref:phage antirepressor KilAC domain-containing protein n=1 Tax=Rhodococcus sp. NPDC058532 TaxID=3346540 RepID=UPI00365836A8
MTELTLVYDQSPFDAIRKVRADGTEYWSARDLMPVMGYARWNEFKNPIDRAIKSAENQNANTADLFRRSTEKSGGRPAEDYELSRFAAYLVAMNGDPNKREVAAAQAYFAIRTREAEVAPAPALTGPELMATALLEAASTLKAKDRQIAELEAPAKAWNNLASANGHYSVAEAAKILSQDPAISTGRDRLFDFMAHHKWIFRHQGKRGGWEAYQTAVDNGRLYERPATPFLNSKTGDYELPAPTIRVTVKGIEKLRGLLGGTGEIEVNA